MNASSERSKKILIWLIAIASAVIILSFSGLLVWFLSDLVSLIVLGALTAYLLDPVAVWFESRDISREKASINIFIGLSVVILTPMLFFFRSLGGGFASTESGFTMDRVSERLTMLASAGEETLTNFGLPTMDLANQVSENTELLAEKTIAMIPDMLSAMADAAIIPIIAFFFLKDGPDLHRRIIKSIPNKYFEFVLNVLHKIDTQLGNYLRVQLVESIIIGIMTAAALGFLGVDYFLVLGFFAGVANLIPYVGGIVGMGPPLFFALLQGNDFSLFVYVFIALISIQVVDNFVLQPIIVGQISSTHPLSAILLALAGGTLFGLIGMLVAVPLAGAIKVITVESVTTFSKYRFESRILLDQSHPLSTNAD